MERNFDYICLYVYKESLMNDFVKKLSKKRYVLHPNIEKDGEENLSSKYTKNKYNKIIINLRGEGSGLPKNHYWFFGVDKEEDFEALLSAIKNSKEIEYNGRFMDIFIHDEISHKVLRKINEIFKKEFGFTLENKKTIIDYI